MCAQLVSQPFQGINPGVYQDSSSTWIELVDGATNKENVPLGPLFIKARHLDVIVAIDGSADDADNWPQ
jgi:lysophospholipase